MSPQDPFDICEWVTIEDYRHLRPVCRAEQGIKASEQNARIKASATQLLFPKGRVTLGMSSLLGEEARYVSRGVWRGILPHEFEGLPPDANL